MVETEKSTRILTSALTWFFLRTVPSSRNANPACMASTRIAPSRMNRASLLCLSCSIESPPCGASRTVVVSRRTAVGAAHILCAFGGSLCCGVAEPFKNLIHHGTVLAIATQLSRVAPAFPAAHFAALARPGLEALELKARAMQLCDALEATLPPDFATAADCIEAALAPPGEVDGDSSRGLAGWSLWSAGEFVARRGIDQPERALRALHAITQRFTAEWALRPFVLRHPELTFATLARWATDPSERVRR